MKQITWFKRNFDFSKEQNIFPSIIERLKGTPILIKHKILNIKEKNLRIKPDMGWSILENIGHLIDLEPIWLGRLDDILNGEKILRTADLENNKTHLADHNSRKAEDLVHEFSEIRNTLVNKLENLTEVDLFRSSMHPRLKTPMRLIDLFYFVAEHDDHHLSRITEIDRSLLNK